MEAFVLLFRGANPNTKLAEDVDSSPYFEDGTAARRFSAVILVRARRNLRPPRPPTTTRRSFSRRPRAAIGETELKREGGKREGGPRRKGNFGECGPAAVNRHEPIIRAGRGECECGAIGRRGTPAKVQMMRATLRPLRHCPFYLWRSQQVNK